MKILVHVFSAIFFVLISTQIFAADNNMMQKAGQAIDDTAITASIEAKYAQDPLVNPFDVGVSTHQGVVTLSGKVNSDTQFERAMIIAESTNGVKDVNGKQLKIASSDQPFTDTYITAEAKGLLLKNELVNGEDFNTWLIHIETKNGVVFVTGKVKNAQEKNKVIDIIRSIDNVKDVKADIEVQK